LGVATVWKKLKGKARMSGLSWAVGMVRGTSEVQGEESRYPPDRKKKKKNRARGKARN